MSAADVSLPIQSMVPQRANEKLIVALDVETVEYAKEIVRKLEGVVDFFKIGLVLQLAEGAQTFIEELLKAKKRVFLDYKFHDIPETVKLAVERASKLGVQFITIHGSSKVIEAAVKGRSRGLKVFTVTVLTSMDEDDLKEMGYNSSVEELVLFRAGKALKAGCDGVISSAREAKEIKQRFGNLLVITPGIRPDGSLEDDQKRRMTPAQAIEAGADYLVVGRPITQSEIYPGNPKMAAQAIIDEMQQVLDARASA